MKSGIYYTHTWKALNVFRNVKLWKKNHTVPVGVQCFPCIDSIAMQEFTWGELYGVGVGAEQIGQFDVL